MAGFPRSDVPLTFCRTILICFVLLPLNDGGCKEGLYTVNTRNEPASSSQTRGQIGTGGKVKFTIFSEYCRVVTER
uniref:Secreted protein n=1 Tax=Timema tahoe TaxID=61484 RepID=A0A7R9FF38_9NEOP|nr:unnamed protein product [Timema tahoe]